jgi:NaMN:DMB phosphoribosyltransferase
MHANAGSVRVVACGLVRNAVEMARAMASQPALD